MLPPAQAEHMGELRVHPVLATWQLSPGFPNAPSLAFRGVHTTLRAEPRSYARGDGGGTVAGFLVTPQLG